MHIALITSPNTVSGESVLCNKLCAAGLTRLHLRKPSWTRGDATRFLTQLEPKTLQTVVLHSWHELTADFAVKGIHYTESARPAPPLSSDSQLTVSTAFHDLKQLQVEWGQLSYAFLSPIFDSISKDEYKAAFDTDSLHADVACCNIPLFALGGKLVACCEF